MADAARCCERDRFRALREELPPMVVHWALATAAAGVRVFALFPPPVPLGASVAGKRLPRQ